MVKMTARVVLVVALLLVSAHVLADPLLTFTAWRGIGSNPTPHLYLLDVGVSGEPVDITPPDADAGSSVWSPDGRRILFSSIIQDGDPDDIDLYTVNPDGSGLQQITNTPNRLEDYPKWSPDGRQIAFHASNPDGWSLWMLDLDSGVERELVPVGGEVEIEATRLAWSPDGRQIAFNAIAEDVMSLYTVHVDTKQLDLLHKGFGYILVQDWLPTGEILVIEGGHPLKLSFLLPNGRLEALFPEIQKKLRILYARSPWRRPDLIVFCAILEDQMSGLDIYSVHRDGSGLQKLTTDGDAVMEDSPDLWTDSLDVLPVGKLATSWGAMKSDRVR